MDLQDFVAQTLIQISSGVKQAQAEAMKVGAEVNPHLTGGPTERASQGFLWASGRAVSVVHFDVALTIVEGTGTKGGIGVFAGAVNLGSSGQSSSENRSVSHVKFSVPLGLPPSAA